MKLCDRCFKKGEYKPSAKEIKTSTHETFDLCESCYQGVADFIQAVNFKKEPGKQVPGKKKKRRK